MLTLKDENATEQDQENENYEENIKVDVTEIGQPDEALLWERKLRRQSKSK